MAPQHFEPTALDSSAFHYSGTRTSELVQLGERNSPQLLVLEGKAEGWAERPFEARSVDASMVDDPRDRLPTSGHGGHALVGSE